MPMIKRKYSNPYKLPHNLYMRMLYLIRDYDRLAQARLDALYDTPENDGQPRASSVGHPTEERACRLARIEDECRTVEQALSHIPEEYRQGIVRNIRNSQPFPLDAHCCTYKRWRQRLVYWTAKEAGFI